MTTQTEARPLFAATLKPHRSLGRRGARLVVVALAIGASIPAVLFFSLGAWPIVGFLGLDVLAIWWALAASARDARQREIITLWPDQLEVRRFDAGGHEDLATFAPDRVKLVIDRDFNERTVEVRLRSLDGDRIIGAFLSAGEKASFAKAFGSALKRARH